MREKRGIEDMLGKQSRLRQVHGGSGQGREGQQASRGGRERGKLKRHRNIAGSQELQPN